MDANNLVLNFQKTNKMKVMSTNSSHSSLHTDYKEKHIQETVNRIFLVLQMCNLKLEEPHSTNDS